MRGATRNEDVADLEAKLQVAKIRAIKDKDLIVAKIDEISQMFEQLDSSNQAHILSVPPVYLTHNLIHNAVFELDVIGKTIDRINNEAFDFKHSKQLFIDDFTLISFAEEPLLQVTKYEKLQDEVVRNDLAVGDHGRRWFSVAVTKGTEYIITGGQKKIGKFGGWTDQCTTLSFDLSTQSF